MYMQSFDVIIKNGLIYDIISIYKSINNDNNNFTSNIEKELNKFSIIDIEKIWFIFKFSNIDNLISNLFIKDNECDIYYLSLNNIIKSFVNEYNNKDSSNKIVIKEISLLIENCCNHNDVSKLYRYCDLQEAIKRMYPYLELLDLHNKIKNNDLSEDELNIILDTLLSRYIIKNFKR